MKFQEFSDANIARAAVVHGGCADWTLNDWYTALTGEVGELGNILKKVRRGDFPLEDVRRHIQKEIGDIVGYTDILATKAGIEMGEATRRKWNEISDRLGYPWHIANDGRIIRVGNTTR